MVQQRGEAVAGDASTEVRMIGTVQDATDLRRAEHEALVSRDSLANAQRIAHLGNWDWDIVADSLTWSDEIYRTFEKQPGDFEATSSAFTEFVHPDDRKRVQEATDRAPLGDTYDIDMGRPWMLR